MGFTPWSSEDFWHWDFFQCEIFHFGGLLCLLKSLLIVSCCRRTPRSEGHGAAGWDIGGSVWLQTVGPKSVGSGNGGANCAALPTANGGHYIAPTCKPMLIWFLCKGRYINYRIFNVWNVTMNCIGRYCGSSIPSRFPLSITSTDSRMWIEYRTSTSPGQAMFAAKYEGTLHPANFDASNNLTSVTSSCSKLVVSDC